MKGKSKVLIGLHALLLVYSMSGICSKMAARFPFLSPQFVGCYAALIAILGIYAIGWQQVIKNLPLSLAYANKAVATVWTCVWSVFIFHEHISVGKLIGIAVIIIGIILYSMSEEKKDEE